MIAPKLSNVKVSEIVKYRKSERDPFVSNRKYLLTDDYNIRKPFEMFCKELTYINSGYSIYDSCLTFYFLTEDKKVIEFNVFDNENIDLLKVYFREI